jgi:AcrR family transcriptional regulator
MTQDEPGTPVPAARSAKAGQTRQAIVDAAMRLFLAGGYDKTTMRAIADEAGVSLGNAYYYFGSKEHLLQAFYDRVQAEHAAAAEDVLAREREFTARLQGLVEAWVDIAEPYHAFAGKFFKTAAEPSSPLSPFSADSAGSRLASTELFRRVVEGSDLKLAADLRRQLPELLWLMHMGVVLFWVHDDSPRQERTRALVGRAVPLVDKVARLTRLPVVRGVVKDVVELVDAIRG